jgi:hypothetical protein
VYRSDAPYQVYRQLRVSFTSPPGGNGGAPGRSGG